MHTRPDPDALLARWKADEARQARGKLKIFFGASAGVGKTYAMLEAARTCHAEGIDVVAGVIEPHDRDETEAMLAGLEVLPRRTIVYRGVTLHEFDLDAALIRRPQLILVDELAHTNAPESRHPKRWQDVLELLAAGIDVYTTVNVQHLESLNDIITQITGVIVRETIPDSVIEQADAIALIDLTPDQLQQRMREGKVYLPQQAEQAARSFFRTGNLHALRELALRAVADRVDAEMERYRQDHAIREPWPASERLLVGIGPNPAASRLIRTARRMATRLRAPWIVLYVETPDLLRATPTEREVVIQNLRLAESLGAETVTLSGARVSETVLRYATQRNVSKIVVGKPANPRWRELVFGSAVDEIIRGSGVIDVYVITGDAGTAAPVVRPEFSSSSARSAYLWAGLVALGCTGLAVLIYPYINVSDLAMIYLPGIVLVAIRFGRGPSVLVSILSVICLNFFFTTPYLTLFVDDPRIVLTLMVMLLVALVISTLTARTHRQAETAIQREQHTSALYMLSRSYASTRGTTNLLNVAVQYTSGAFAARIAILLPDSEGVLRPWAGLPAWQNEATSSSMLFEPTEADIGIAHWVFDHGEPAGLSTNTLPSATAIYLPLSGTQGIVGVLGVQPAQVQQILNPEQRHLLDAFASQTAVAFERAVFAEVAQRTAVQMEAERTRNALLSSVSHDLRTPLAVVTGALSSVLDAGNGIDDATRIELLTNAYDEAERLSRLLNNILEMTRLEAGGMHARKEWHPLEEVVGAALTRLERQLGGRDILVELADDLPLIPLDAVLIEQVLVNLLENALKYTPATSPITISASVLNDTVPPAVQVRVADRGPGVPPGSEDAIFTKFTRGLQPTQSGVGLGLTISRGIIHIHGGTIWCEARPGGGAVFVFTLPIEGTPPSIEPQTGHTEMSTP
ncbi:MAG TPA: sensor histidine kinase KdpD [Roseiflexaceae bacterium]|nr:sensor histidine kinase KdpD [Roseiflexaceae bacterium]